MAVYRGYSQDQLNAQYDQRTLVPDLAPYLARWRSGTQEARTKWPEALGLSYGLSPRERIDIFGATERGRRPVLAFLHGGAWHQLSLDESGYIAPAFVDAGVLVASLDFDLVPNVSLDTQVTQAKRAAEWLLANANSYGGDAERLVLCGHSSGAHLAAMIVTTGLPVGGVVMVSGSYDLEPVRLSARNDYLRLDQNGARRNSPAEWLRPGLPPAIVAYGTGELDEFKRQARDFAACWQATGGSIDLIERPGLNHFDMSCDITDPESPLHLAIRRMVAAA